MAPSRTSPALPPSAQEGAELTPSQLASYQRNGYLIIPDALSPSTISALLAETHHLLSTISLSSHPMTRFSTGTGSSKSHVGDDYFLTSGDKIRFFFEEDAFSPQPPHTLLRPAPQSINKIGHSLHTLSPPFRTLTFSPLFTSIARSLGFHDPRVLQSMIICKQPGIGGAVPPHQDSSFLYTDPPSAVGFWIALEDAGKGNGGLGVWAGSHRVRGVEERFVRLDGVGKEGKGGGTGFVRVDGGRFPRGEGQRTEEDEGEGKGVGDEDGEYKLADVKAGTLVLIHGNTLHKSERNLSDKSRFVYTFHVIEGQNEYDERNWLQPPAGGFSRLFQDGA